MANPYVARRITPSQVGLSHRCSARNAEYRGACTKQESGRHSGTDRSCSQIKVSEIKLSETKLPVSLALGKRSGLAPEPSTQMDCVCSLSCTPSSSSKVLGCSREAFSPLTQVKHQWWCGFVDAKRHRRSAVHFLSRTGRPPPGGSPERISDLLMAFWAGKTPTLSCAQTDQRIESAYARGLT